MSVCLERWSIQSYWRFWSTSMSSVLATLSPFVSLYVAHKCRIFTGYQPPLPLWFLHRWCVAYNIIVQHVYTSRDMLILYVVPMACRCGMVVLTQVFGMSVVVRICTKGLRLCAIYGLLSILMPGPVIDSARMIWLGL